MPASASELGPLAPAERVTVAPDEQPRRRGSASDATARSSGPVVPSATSGDAAVPLSSTSSTHGSGIGSPLDAEHAVDGEERAPVGEELGADLADERLLQRRSTLPPRTTVPPTRARRGGDRGSARPCAPPRRSRRRPPRSRARGGRAAVGRAAPPRTRRPPRRRRCSSTSMPTMSPSTAPMRDATSPSAPGRSGSQTRTRTWMTSSGSRSRMMLRAKMTRVFQPE